MSPLLGRYLRSLVERANETGLPRADDHAVQPRSDRRRGRRWRCLLDGSVRPRGRRRGRRLRGRCRPACASTWAGRRATCAWSTAAACRSAAAKSWVDRWRCRCSRSTRSAPAAARSRGGTAAARSGSGPRSAGADPGPACYGSGGTEPTVTDANLVLGSPVRRRAPWRRRRTLTERPRRRAVGKPRRAARARAHGCAEGTVASPAPRYPRAPGRHVSEESTLGGTR